MPLTTNAEFEAFYAETFRDVLAFVRRRAHPLIVEEVVSETYLIAWRRRAEIPSTARPWLFTVARNVMLATSRGEQRQRELSVRLAAEEEHNGASSDHAGGVAVRMALRDAWAELSAADQEVLSLDLFDKLPTAEAASVIGCTRAAFSMRLSRARRRLAVALRRHEYGPSLDSPLTFSVQ